MLFGSGASFGFPITCDHKIIRCLGVPPPTPIPDWRRFARRHPKASIGVDFSDLVQIGVGPEVLFFRSRAITATDALYAPPLPCPPAFTQFHPSSPNSPKLRQRV